LKKTGIYLSFGTVRAVFCPIEKPQNLLFVRDSPNVFYFVRKNSKIIQNLPVTAKNCKSFISRLSFCARP
jgi:hypothetical protein